MINLLTYVFLFFSSIDALVVRNNSGELFYYEMPTDLSFQEGLLALQLQQNSLNEPLVDFMATNGSTNISKKSAKHSVSVSRDYFAPLKPSEKEDISYIVNTLGLGSLGKIAKSKSNLKKVGDRVEHVHPLNFIHCIFADEKCRASFHALKERSWVWNGFKEGLIGSLSDEAAVDNLKEEYIIDFSKKLGMEYQEIWPDIAKKDWNLLLKNLTRLLPRQGDPGRYAM